MFEPWLAHKKEAEEDGALPPLTSRPTMQQSEEMLGQVPEKGGWFAITLAKFDGAATSTDVMMRCQEVIDESKGKFIPIKHHDVTEKHVNDIRDEMIKMVFKQPNGKSVPGWEAPMELLKMLLRPQRVLRAQRHGVGYKKRFHAPNGISKMATWSHQHLP